MNKYKIEFDDLAEKQLSKLAKQSQKQIIIFLENLLIKINQNGVNPFKRFIPL
jgi:mRNA-degrading endonuclease RelE of RelBE toxin-antitoxin system